MVKKSVDIPAGIFIKEDYSNQFARRFFKSILGKKSEVISGGVSEGIHMF